MVTHCRIQLSLVFDKQQSYILIKATFEKEPGIGSNHLIDSGKQTMNFKFYVDAFDSPDGVKFTKVEDYNGLPNGLKHPAAMDIVQKGTLYKINLIFNASGVVQEGVHDPLGSAQFEKLANHNQFAAIQMNNKIDVFLEVADTFISGLKMLKAKWRQDLSRPAFSEYYSKKGNYM